MRTPIVIANWKMNGGLAANANLVSGLKKQLVGQQATTIVICPPAPYLAQVEQLIESSNIQLGAQNASEYSVGAYTGEVSLKMLQEFGVQYVIIGHSERRVIFKETDQQVAEKCKAVVAGGLVPVICIGESLEERQQGNAQIVIKKQLQALSLEELRGSFIIAYEPIWAIGTGETASPEQAQEMHEFIRFQLRELLAERADSVKVLYGGSVKSDNAGQLFAMPDIDGGLVGGASLQAEEFFAICRAAGN
ncbi:triose-phosphate isomerase [Endozoicomonas sp. SM1973]|uniref:Triosephosphate isomerase n=1 Tax=Spartinivicinus marinus TaxID=2994442 RepID=A0A853IKN7_9GAMM|nr:triose-phosphate isomerase [Spartinivicinus marinus]MCX4027980.1 triose-phosphate isomerase [Spartinivicinus marinus]NYZ68256.1 triose-phosphate isomerase [Spartinivicinus marinus]